MLPERLPITGLPTGEVPDAVLVCGDPERASQASESLHGTELLSSNREYRCYRGMFEGTELAVCSHGIGASGAAIAFEELIAAGARRIIRVGTCGSLQPNVMAGHLIIATSAVQNSGYGVETVPPGYPAVADVELTLALRREADASKHAFSSGIILTRDSFYRGVEPIHNPDYRQMSEANVLAVEMECAALFIVGALRRVQTGAILAVDGNVLTGGGEQMATYRPRQDVVKAAVEAEIDIALRALARLQHVAS